MSLRLAAIEKRVHERVGAEFNLGSPQQLGKVLFEDLEVHRLADLPKPKRTPTGPVQDRSRRVREARPHHEVPSCSCSNGAS
jgi:DNA polymerase-1